MKHQLGNFRLLEQIEPGGYTTVYRAEEDLGQGFTRPAAVKVLHAMDLDDEHKVAILRREVDVLVELSSCPNIVTIYGVGIDDEVGPWIAMELAGRSLKRFITDDPAEPDQVRVLLRDALRALMVVHGADPPILHRDLKPNNMLSTSFGTWVIADFGLARRWAADDTLHLATVQYAAPELLDTSLGVESPRMDLYALGMAAYEFALGRALYRKQFPSVYDPYSSTRDTAAEGDLRPKWMYWHTSMQMSVPALADIIEDYPRDLSDLIASMIKKTPAERAESAAHVLAHLGDVEGSIAMTVDAPDLAEEALIPSRWRTPALAALAALVLVVGTATILWTRARAAPTVEFTRAEYVGPAPIEIDGVIERFPRGGGATIELDDGATFDVIGPYADGGFTSNVKPRELGQYDGMLKIRDAHGRLAGKPHRVRVERIPPESVEVILATYPVVPETDILITPSARPGEVIRQRTGRDGKVHVDVPYGAFQLSVAHPRYRPKAGPMNTGFDNTFEPPAIRMEEIPMEEIYAEMRELIDRIKRLATKKANCPPGPLSESESRDMGRRIEKLHSLGEGDLDVEAFIDAVGSVRDCEPESIAAVESTIAAVTAAIDEKEMQHRASMNASGERSGGAGAPSPGRLTRDRDAGGDQTQRLIEQLVEAGGDPELVRRLIESGGDPEVIRQIIQAAIEGGSGRLPSLASVGQGALLELPLDVFQRFIEVNVPLGAMTVEAVPRLDKVRVIGPVFNETELTRLTNRLLPAITRLQLELRVDAWAVCRHLEEKLEDEGVLDVRVHAHLTPGDHAMYVSFASTDDLDVDSVADLARACVIDPDLVFVRMIADPSILQAGPRADQELETR